jgi:hypothetical protein
MEWFVKYKFPDGTITESTQKFKSQQEVEKFFEVVKFEKQENYYTDGETKAYVVKSW